MFPQLLFALASLTDACGYLPEQEVRQVFEIPSTTPICMLRADGCSYLWMGLPPTGPQLREALMSGKRLPPRANESLSIRIETVPSAVRELDARFDLLSKGSTVERAGRPLPRPPRPLRKTSRASVSDR